MSGRGRDSAKHGYQGFVLQELLHGQAVGCSENTSTVPNAATPARKTDKGPSVCLFINPHKNKRETAEILDKCNPASTGSVTCYMSCQRVCRTTLANDLLSRDFLPSNRALRID